MGLECTFRVKTVLDPVLSTDLLPARREAAKVLKGEQAAFTVLSQTPQTLPNRPPCSVCTGPVQPLLSPQCHVNTSHGKVPRRWCFLVSGSSVHP